MTEEQRLLEKLRLVEALFSGGATDGERAAAAMARDRILARLEEQAKAAPPPEFTFTTPDEWGTRLLIALMRRYSIRPYRYPRQRRTTVMARVPRKFVDEVLWPEYLTFRQSLFSLLDEVTQRVISEAIGRDDSDAEVVQQRGALEQPQTQATMG